MLKVLMLTPHLDVVGGTERQCLKLATALAHHGVETTILTMRPTEHSRANVPADIAITRLDSPGVWVRRMKRYLRAKRAISPNYSEGRAGVAGNQPSRSFLRELGSLVGHKIPTQIDEAFLERTITRLCSATDVVHLHGVFWLPMLRATARACRATNTPYLVKITNEPERTWRSLKADPAAVGALSTSSGIITVNKHTQGYFQCRFPHVPTHFIPNGTDIPTQSPVAPIRDVLFLGTLKKQKGVDVLMRAWAMTKCTDGHRLLIVGDGPERRALEDLARSLGIEPRVRFLGLRHDVDQLLARRRVFVLPSRWEGMPNALIEAMAHGLPCISTSVDGVTDVLDDGKSGLLVEPENPKALALALDRVLTDHAMASRLGGYARARVIQRFSILAIIKEYMQLYEKFLVRHPNPRLG